MPQPWPKRTALTDRGKHMKQTMAKECADHWVGPPYTKSRRVRRWQYSYAAMAKLRRAAVIRKEIA